MLISALPTFAAEGVKVETVLEDLDGPTAVAIRPDGTAGSYEVFVAESGARRVIKVDSGKPSEIVEVITGFPESSDREVSDQVGNPRSLLFVDRERLATVIADEPGEIRLFELSDAKDAVAADQPKQVVTLDVPEGEAGERSDAGTAIARTRANDAVSDLLLVACGSTVRQISLRAGTFGKLAALDAGSAPMLSSKATALAVGEQGYVVVAEEEARSRNSAIVFLNPKSGKAVLRVKSNLREIKGLAYCPKSGGLYAIGRSDGAGGKDGVFRIDDNGRPSSERSVVGMQIADVTRPTALVFGTDDSLYVTLLGTANDGSLVRISGEL